MDSKVHTQKHVRVKDLVYRDFPGPTFIRGEMILRIWLGVYSVSFPSQGREIASRLCYANDLQVVALTFEIEFSLLGFSSGRSGLEC